jgi:tetratricopeptide (TPR) repeat protein
MKSQSDQTRLYPPGFRLSFRPIIGTDGRVPKAAQPWLMESPYLHLFVLTPPGGFASEEELNAVLEKYMPLRKKPKFPKPKEPWHQAQELAYQGWEKKSARGRSGAARSALSISTEAPDAYLLLAHDSETWAEAIQLEAEALAAATRLMENHSFDPDEDPYWDSIITRPYMRARFALGYSRWRIGAHGEARERLQELIRLNPEDNQGARYALAAILLEQGENGEAQRLMASYYEDNRYHWSYNKTLQQYRRKGNHASTRDLLRQAINRNPIVHPYLLNKSTIDSWELDAVEAGEESEAIEYFQLYREAWKVTPGALDWLAEASSSITGKT